MLNKLNENIDELSYISEVWATKGVSNEKLEAIYKQYIGKKDSPSERELDKLKKNLNQIYGVSLTIKEIKKDMKSRFGISNNGVDELFNAMNALL